MYKWQQVKAMQRNGTGAKTIAKQLNLSRNTVKKYMRSDNPPAFDAPKREKLCDAFSDEILDMLVKKYIGTRIFNELVKIGFKGSLSSVHRHIAGIKKELTHEKATTRVETKPAEQMQYDWKEWILPVKGVPAKIYIHELVLSYSRKKYWASSFSIKAADIMRAIIEGFYFFGGSARVLVIDNPKQLVVSRKDSHPRFNDEFLLMCGVFGIEPFACKPYRAQTKGKVERPFFYLQEHLLRGLSVDSINEFDQLLIEFTGAYNERVHSTLRESPNARFMQEKPLLRAIPKIEPGQLFVRYPRKVSNDGYVSFDGRLYAVPMHLCLRDVFVESIFSKTLRVFDFKGEFVCEHEILPVGSFRPPHPEHEKQNEIFLSKRKSKIAKTIDRFTEVFGSDLQGFIDGVKFVQGPNAMYHLTEIISYADIYDAKAVFEAILLCQQIGSFNKASVAKLIEGSKLSPVPVVKTSSTLPTVSIDRELSFYRVEAAYVK